jgi:hypothetical protein
MVALAGGCSSRRCTRRGEVLRDVGRGVPGVPGVPCRRTAISPTGLIPIRLLSGGCAGGAGGGRDRGGLGAADHGPDPGDEFAQAERLGEVVVGAEFQPDDPVGFSAVVISVAGHPHHMVNEFRDPTDLSAAECDGRDLPADPPIGRWPVAAM